MLRKDALWDVLGKEPTGRDPWPQGLICSGANNWGDWDPEIDTG